MTENTSARIVSIIMSAITMFIALFGLFGDSIKGGQPSVIQGFESREENVIRIMSFNIRCTNVGSQTWESRIGIVSQTILNGEPDSVGVQEATPAWMSSLNSTLAEKYASVGVGRDDGKNLGEYSAIFYLKDRYSLISSGTFWLSQTPSKVSYGWDAACRRVCTWAVLEDKTTGQRYVHINSHFDHIGVEARKNSVQLILDKAAEYPELPVVFTADMNVDEGSENYVQITTTGCLSDAKMLAPDTMSYCTYHDTKPELHASDIIDYIMINDHFDATVYRVITEGVDGRYVSDHFPIYADLKIK